MTKLILSDDGLSLPLDVVTQTIGIVAKRRAGKSFLARRLTEQLFKAGQQIIIIDPKGDWWGIRSSRDGRGPGLPILIIGGEHGDIPLEAGSGEVVAKLVVEERVSALLDLSSLRKHEVATFSTAFLETLYRLKNREQYRTPLMLLIDEADAIAPQKPQPNEARMLGAIEDVVRRGGQRGMGCTFITQRTAVLNKNVLTQAQILIALRTIAPQDIAAMNAWIDVHGEPEQRKTLMESLPSLPVGDAWVWSPGWPTDKGIFQRMHTAPIETFDSGATPKPGQKRIEPKSLADVDLDAVRRQMAETLERAKADDPRELRKRIAELERQVRDKPKPAPSPRLTRADLTSVHHLQLSAEQLVDGLTKLRARMISLAGDGDDFTPSEGQNPTPRTFMLNEQHTTHVTKATVRREATPDGKWIVRDGSLPIGQRKILSALAQYPTGRTRTQVAILTGYAHNGGGFRNHLGALRSRGCIEGLDPLRITDAGLKTLGDFEPLPTGAALLDHWLGVLSKAERTALHVLAAAYPKALTKEQVAQRAGYEAEGGGFRNALGKLRTLELISGRGELRASDDLFQEVR